MGLNKSAPWAPFRPSLYKMAEHSTRAFNGTFAPSGGSYLRRHGQNFTAFSSTKGLSLKRSRQGSVFFAASNPVAEVEKTLKKTASTVADKVKGGATQVTEQVTKPSLTEVILLQGTLVLLLPCT